MKVVAVGLSQKGWLKGRHSENHKTNLSKKLLTNKCIDFYVTLVSGRLGQRMITVQLIKFCPAQRNVKASWRQTTKSALIILII